MRLLAQLIVVLAAIAVSACAPPRPDPFTGWFEPYRDCRERYAEIDARIDAAGVRDASFYRVPGYPYLRTDRTLASFADEVRTIDEVGGWLRHMREYDQESRDYELINLGLPLSERAWWRDKLRDCGRGLAAIELSEPEQIDRLRTVVAPPDLYAGAIRALGLDLLMRPFLEAELAARRDRLLAAFAGDAGAGRSDGTLWTVDAQEDPAKLDGGFAAAVPDELGYPGFLLSHWRALAERYAPALRVAVDSPIAHPGAPVWTEDGIAVDPRRAEVYYRITFARTGNERLVQLNYFFWFQRRQGAGVAPIDGFIWRVTLNASGERLAYERLHMSGGEVLWFPAHRLHARQPEAPVRAPLVPQPWTPEGPVVLDVAGDGHALRHVGLLDGAGASRPLRRYRLVAYEDLYTLPLPGGGSRSLFGPDGIVPGTESRSPSWLLTLAGVRSSGALKQIGHHPVAYLSRAHFDDVDLIDRYFLRSDDAMTASRDTGAAVPRVQNRPE